MAVVVVEGVSKAYASARPVLDQVSVELADCEFVCLMGPSGSGKSTLLTMIGAMSRPTSGRVLIDDIDVYALSDERRADFRREYLGFVFQQHHLMPYLNALQNVMLPLAPVRVRARTKRDRAMSVLERVGMGDKAVRLPGQLSGGEQGRLAIARALVNEPPLLLADEPTGALDSATGREIMELFCSLNRQGQTVFMVTHNPDNASLAHRVLRMRDGQIASCATGSAAAVGANSTCRGRQPSSGLDCYGAA